MLNSTFDKSYFTNKRGELTIPKELLNSPNAFMEVPIRHLAVSLNSVMGFSILRAMFFEMSNHVKGDPNITAEDDFPLIRKIETSTIVCTIPDITFSNVYWVHTHNSYYLVFNARFSRKENETHSIIITNSIPTVNAPLDILIWNLDKYEGFHEFCYDYRGEPDGILPPSTVMPEKVELISNKSMIYKVTIGGKPFYAMVNK